MEELFAILKLMGIPENVQESLKREYANDCDGLTMYILGCLAKVDDRHEFVD